MGIPVVFGHLHSLKLRLKLYDGTLCITKYKGIGGDVAIPEQIDGKTVTQIYHYAFMDCTLITSIVIPDSVKDIGYYAFSGCTSITSITIPANVTNLIRKSPDKNSTYYGVAHPFANCTSLTDVNISEKNREYKSVDGIVYSKDGTKLLIYPAGRKGNFEIPNGVVEIEDMAFYSNKFIALLVISNEVETIGTEAFTGCDSLKTVIIPESVTNIDYSFSGGYNFTVYGVIGSYANQYADDERLKFVDISKVHIDKLNGIILQLYDKSTVDNTELKVISVETDLDNTVIYDITLLDKNGNQIQPEESITVKIPLPFSYDVKIKVYRKEANNQYTDMNASYSDGYMVFTTDHFSEYTVTAQNLIPDTITGDVNGDNSVNDRDSILLDRYLAEWGSEVIIEASDMNGDGKVNDQDSIILARTLAGWYD